MAPKKKRRCQNTSRGKLVERKSSSARIVINEGQKEQMRQATINLPNDSEIKISNLISQLHDAGFESLLMTVRVLDNSVSRYGSALAHQFLDKSSICTEFQHFCEGANDCDNLRQTLEHEGASEQVLNDKSTRDIRCVEEIACTVEQTEGQCASSDIYKHMVCKESEKTAGNDDGIEMTPVKSDNVKLDNKSNEHVKPEENTGVGINNKCKKNPRITNGKRKLDHSMCLIDFLKTEFTETDKSAKRATDKIETIERTDKVLQDIETGASKPGKIQMENFHRDEDQQFRASSLSNCIPKADISDIVNHNKTVLHISEMDCATSERDECEEDKNFVGLAESVIYNYENIEQLKEAIDVSEDDKYHCLFCDACFPSRERVLHHIDLHIHLINAPLEVCDICDCRLPIGLVRHHRMLHSSGRRALPPVVIPIKRDIRNDIAFFFTRLMHVSSVPVKCRFCDLDFTNCDGLKRHFMSQHTFKYKCKVCNSIIHGFFKVYKHLQEHKYGSEVKEKIEKFKFQKKTGEKKDERIPCPYCERTCTNKSALIRHVDLKHVDEKYNAFPCSKCKKTFVSESARNCHMKSHKNKTCPFEDCKTICGSQLNLQRHMETNHGERVSHTRSYLCSQCGLTFKAKYLLDAHISVDHDGIYTTYCSICSKPFRHKETLKRHMETHSDVNNYMCDICGEKFKTKTAWWRHKLQHSNSKRFRCNSCFAAFTTKDNLNVHIVNNKHFSESQPESSIKYVHCPHCLIKLVNKKQLWRHIETRHTEPLKCSYCRKTFNDKSNLKCHEQQHTNTRPTCYQCAQTFRSRLKLSEHLKDMHNMDEKDNVRRRITAAEWEYPGLQEVIDGNNTGKVYAEVSVVDTRNSQPMASEQLTAVPLIDLSDLHGQSIDCAPIQSLVEATEANSSVTCQSGEVSCGGQAMDVQAVLMEQTAEQYELHEVIEMLDQGGLGQVVEGMQVTHPGEDSTTTPYTVVQVEDGTNITYHIYK